MKLLDYWPSKKEVNNCIKDQAENASDEVLLAVHQAFPIANFRIGPDGKVLHDSRKIASEDELLFDLLNEDVPSGSHVVPITGASGAGKSHLIRILDAKLRRVKDAERYLVIRIPKSASLRRVVELILDVETLKDKKYDNVKAEFKTALEDVPLHQAVIRFQAQLEICLQEYAESLKSSLKFNPNDTALKEKTGHAIFLPKLMQDAEAVEHFRENVFPRIIKRTVGDEEFIDSVDGQFKVTDLDLQNLDFEKANISIARYYNSSLKGSGEHGKTVAVVVLNDVLDQATRALYKLSQSFGGMTLGEVVLEIRRLLLIDKKELVLLVEDFFALVGIQDTLAKVLIQEGITSKGNEYATIRSAIAVTDGYLVGRDTLATRAGREWVVESRLDTVDEVLGRTKALVASYINAARCGEETIKEHFRKNISNNNILWQPPLFNEGMDDDVPYLSEFGYEKNVPLFPFTNLAIEGLAQSALESGGELVFNPRFIIKHVIIAILKHRDSFLNGQFPNDIVSTLKPSINVREWLQYLPVSHEDKVRLQALVTIWGNNPERVHDVELIPSGVFEAFGLIKPEIPVEDITETRNKLVNQKLSTKDIDSKKDIKDKPQIDKKKRTEFESFQAALNEWVQNSNRIESKYASVIRTQLASLINERINWNEERCTKRPFSYSDFSIPNASGEQGLSSIPIITGTLDNYKDGSLPSELQALFRYSVTFAKSLNYPEVSDDLVKIANLFDRLLPQVLLLLRSETLERCRVAVLALSENSKIIGGNDIKKSLKGIRAFLFSEYGPIETLQSEAPQEIIDWNNLQKKALEIRPDLLKLVIDLSGCFQGTSDNPNGIDILRIADMVPDIDEQLKVTQLSWVDNALRQKIKEMALNRVNARCKKVLKVAKIKKNFVNDKLGNKFDKIEVAEEFEKLANSLGGSWRTDDLGFSKKQFTNKCDTLKKSALAEMHLFDKVVNSDKECLTLVSQMKFSPLLETESFVDMSTKLVLSAKKHADALESQYEGIDPMQKAQDVITEFDKLIDDLTFIQEERDDLVIK